MTFSNIFTSKSHWACLVIGNIHHWLMSLIIVSSYVMLTPLAYAEDGYELWLRYQTPQGVKIQAPSAIVTPCDDPSESLLASVSELQRAFKSLVGVDVRHKNNVVESAIVLMSPKCTRNMRGQPIDFESYQPEEFRLQRHKLAGKSATLISAQTDVSVLYGVFDYLRLISRGDSLGEEVRSEAPSVKLRLLNHWDNLDRHVERGYAGQSIWDWHRLPGYIDVRYIDYARANASIGINGTVLTNVNADATVLTEPYLKKVKALADTFRPYGIRVYLTARFSAPIELGGLETADPLDPAVQAWWAAKVEEIYLKIPDFGGFLVKANSEGQPGPQDYGRTHADGANMLADALKPFDGYVMWRAFVYSADNDEDRTKQAFDEFVPLDEKFNENVLVQVKNGPLDFQPREPFHPMFGQMPKTPLVLEAQITKEYLGFSTHLAYLGTLWEEVLQSETYVSDKPSKVFNVIDGSLHDYKITGMAGVANIGTDRNWSGSIFDQANWFAFGRLAWDPERSAEGIAQEWAKLTFSTSQEQTNLIVDMMMSSRQVVVDYMTPLGMTHLMGTGHHYGPAPWVDDLGRADWNPYYYHRATKDAIGIDRSANGTNAVSQYSEKLNQKWSNIATTEEEYLLWFHRLPWDHEMENGQTLWEVLSARYERGILNVGEFQRSWELLEDQIDPERHKQVSQFLQIQANEARWWRDASMAYWMSVNGRDLPIGISAPERSLNDYKEMEFPNAPGQGE